MIRALCATAAIIAATIMPASAQWAQWADVGAWNVVGSSKDKACMTGAVYPNGVSINIMLKGDSVRFALQGGSIRVTNGEPFKVLMQTTSTDPTYIYGHGNGSDMVVFNMPAENLLVLARDRQLAVEGLGVFNLKGSMAAIKETLACYRAMNGMEA